MQGMLATLTAYHGRLTCAGGQLRRGGIGCAVAKVVGSFFSMLLGAFGRCETEWPATLRLSRCGTVAEVRRGRRAWGARALDAPPADWPAVANPG